MILAFCVDDQGGLAFNHRRQSRDRGLVADLLAAAGATATPQTAVPAPLIVRNPINKHPKRCRCGRLGCFLIDSTI